MSEPLRKKKMIFVKLWVDGNIDDILPADTEEGNGFYYDDYEVVEEFFFAEDIKSAVQGLLEEIEKEKRIWKNSNHEIENIIEWFEKLIKKWFADVFENDEKG